MALHFYTNPMSRGQIARWALHEVGAEYRQHLVAYGAEMHSEAYRAINPMAKVPALVDDGAVITECAAICAYLAETFPAAGLAPQPEERAGYYRWLLFAAGPLEQAITANSMGWHEQDPQKQGMLGFGSFDRVVDTLQAHLEGSAFAAGRRFTAADVYLGSQVIWGVQFGTLPKRDAFVAYAERLTGREAYRSAKAIDQALIAEAKAAAST